MASTATQVAPPDSPTLSASQLKTLAEVGEERTADAGDVLYRIGDASYPFIAILEGEVAIVDAACNPAMRTCRSPPPPKPTRLYLPHAADPEESPGTLSRLRVRSVPNSGPLGPTAS